MGRVSNSKQSRKDLLFAMLQVVLSSLLSSLFFPQTSALPSPSLPLYAISILTLLFFSLFFFHPDSRQITFSCYSLIFLSSYWICPSPSCSSLPLWALGRRCAAADAGSRSPAPEVMLLSCVLWEHHGAWTFSKNTEAHLPVTGFENRLQKREMDQ